MTDVIDGHFTPMTTDHYKTTDVTYPHFHLYVNVQSITPFYKTIAEGKQEHFPFKITTFITTLSLCILDHHNFFLDQINDATLCSRGREEQCDYFFLK